MQVPVCPICKRDLGSNNISKHHLTPKARGGRHSDVVHLHNICHQKIHSVFTIKELKNDFNTIERLLAHQEILKFVKWVAKKDVSFYQSNHRMNSKSKKYRR